MNSYFREKDFTYTEHAIAICHELDVVVRQIFKREIAAGFSPRELSLICMNCVSSTEAETVLAHAAELHEKAHKELMQNVKEKLHNLSPSNPWSKHKAIIETAMADPKTNNNQYLLKAFTQTEVPSKLVERFFERTQCKNSSTQ